MGKILKFPDKSRALVKARVSEMNRRMFYDRSRATITLVVAILYFWVLVFMF